MENLPNFDKAVKMLEDIFSKKLNAMEILYFFNALSVYEPEKLCVYAFEVNNSSVKIGVTKNID